jgi:phosphoketolase
LTPLGQAIEKYEPAQIDELASSLRRTQKQFSDWANGYGVISHANLTQVRIYQLVERLLAAGQIPSLSWAFQKLTAADRLASAAMWLTVHMTYAQAVNLSGRTLEADEFKQNPEGHTGGSLNIVPGYVGYLASNVLTGVTRSWIMGQGHSVAAVEAINALVDNMSPAQERRYSRSDAGLTKLVQDFYSYAIQPDGKPAAPIGSHVNAHTGGGISEGGYLGFAEVEYVHMPLKGEHLVAFLSDGAFEEQRGSDWTPRWWRAEDSGPVIPIMILNGRRIEQRSQIEQQGGAEWLCSHLKLNGFEPIDIDGRDPAAFAWAIVESEQQLKLAAEKITAHQITYPVQIPYVIAHTVKGYGFYGADTNRAHNLPLPANPRKDSDARRLFHEGARNLWVAPNELEAAVKAFAVHAEQQRVKERDHSLATRNVAIPASPEPEWRNLSLAESTSPMATIDAYFVRLIAANPQLRVRVGNPDELSSNQMNKTLARLKHRVNGPECGVAEAINGSVITVLNEEAVIGAALGNKGGINLCVSYEAFAVKMLGALRQEIIFARHQKEVGRKPGWLGIPLIVTSHTWENGKNEQSHQDPTIAEALLGEMSDMARVMFPVDSNSAVQSLRSIYSSKGQIGCLIVPKRPVPDFVRPEESLQLCDQGALTWAGSPRDSVIQLVAIGAYQLIEAARAHDRLKSRGIKSCVTIILEPGRLREPRDTFERDYVLGSRSLEEIFPPLLPRVVLTHTRPESMTGILRRIDNGSRRMQVLGFINRGGTLDTEGMLFANRCSWAHQLQSAASLLQMPIEELMSVEEIAAVEGRGNPQVIMRRSSA